MSERRREVGIRMALGADSHAGSAAVLLLVALLAAWLPARQAARLSPVTAMR